MRMDNESWREITNEFNYSNKNLYSIIKLFWRVFNRRNEELSSSITNNDNMTYDKLTYDKMSMTDSHGGILVNVFYQLNN